MSIYLRAGAFPASMLLTMGAATSAWLTQAQFSNGQETINFGGWRMASRVPFRRGRVLTVRFGFWTTAWGCFSGLAGKALFLKYSAQAVTQTYSVRVWRHSAYALLSYLPPGQVPVWRLHRMETGICISGLLMRPFLGWVPLARFGESSRCCEFDLEPRPQSYSGTPRPTSPKERMHCE